MRWLISIAVLFVLMGCAGGAASQTPPDWVVTPPAANSTSTFFTGAGTSKEGDQAKAEEIALGALMDEIMRYLGVKVTAQTTATARASVDSFQSDVRQQLTQTGSGNIAGLQIAGKYVDKRPNGLTVYLLAKYGTADLAKEKKRLEDVFREQVEAVSGPEKEAQDLEAAGSFYAATARYLDAAAAAAKSGIDNAKIKFERVINSAKAALDHVSLVKINDNLTTAAGSDFSEPFTLKVVSGATAKDPGIPDVVLSVSYVEFRQDKKQIRTVSLKTDKDGMARFTHPTPQFVGPEKVTMMLDLTGYLEPLQKLSKDLATMVGGLEDIAVRKKAVFSLETYSGAREIEMGIAVAALDASGAPVAGNDLQSGILKKLNDARFKVKALVIAAASIAGQSDEDVIAAAAAKAGATTGRIIFGTAGVTGTEQDGEMVIVNVSGTLKVADAKSGAILLTVNRNKQGLGKNAAVALSTALQKLGEDMGQDVANKLR